MGIFFSIVESFFFQLPLDLSTLTEAQRKARMDARKPRKRLHIVEDLEDNFRSKQYLKYVKKQK